MYKLNKETHKRVNSYGNNNVVVETGKSYRRIDGGQVEKVTRFTWNAFMQNGVVCTSYTDKNGYEREASYDLDEFIEKFMEG